VFVSPALQRGEKGFHKSVTESRRDGARTSKAVKKGSFVSGHDFSRAANATKKRGLWPLSDAFCYDELVFKRKAPRV